MLEALSNTKAKVVGMKQTLRALRLDQATRVYLADDIDPVMARKIIDVCHEKGVEFEKTALGQVELGKLCKIEVGASVVTLIRNQ